MAHPDTYRPHLPSPKALAVIPPPPSCAISLNPCMELSMLLRLARLQVSSTDWISIARLLSKPTCGQPMLCNYQASLVGEGSG